MTAGPDVAANRALVLARVAAAAVRAGRDPASVVVVAVTKTVDAERIRAAIDAGFDALGENRVQERQSKAAELEGAGTRAADTPRWHLLGPLQSNKARRAIELFDTIQTVDSLDLARRLDRLAPEGRPELPRYPVLLQVNVDADEAKAGFDPAGLGRDLGAILDLPHLSIDGLMTVGRLVSSAESARSTFARLRQLSERLRARDARLGAALSMGMTDDFEVAIEEGATHVRIGRAIFGERPHVG